MLMTSTPATTARGHRVRELVCACPFAARQRRTSGGVPTLALHGTAYRGGHACAAYRGPGRRGVRRCLSLDQAPAPRLACALPRHAHEHICLDAGCLRSRMPDAGNDRADRGSQPPERRSDAKPGRRSTHDAALRRGGCSGYRAARSPHRRRAAPVNSASERQGTSRSGATARTDGNPSSPL